jgi:hypothetical protein
MIKKFLSCVLLSATGFCATAQVKEFSVGELVALKGQDVRHFDKSVTKKGYTYMQGNTTNKQSYSYILQGDKKNVIHSIHFAQTGQGPMITYGTTNEMEQQQWKKQLDEAGFRFTRSEPTQLNGRSVKMDIYKEGKAEADVFSTIVNGEEHALVKIHMIRVK